MISRCAIAGRRPRVRPSPFRWYASTPLKPKKDLPSPLPPKASPSSSSSSSSSQTQTQSQTKLSPAQAKKEYLEAQKRTGEFLKDPKKSIARLQADMDRTKEKLLRVHDKPIWRRIVDRFKAKQHGVINLLAASMAYILAHRLHLKMKANEELLEQVDLEKTKNSELRSLLRLLSSEEFAKDVVLQATTAKTEDASTDTKSSWFGSSTSSSSSLPQKEALVTSLRQTLEARIGDEGLEDADRKQKKIQDIWEENEQRIEDTEEGKLAALAAAIAAEGHSQAATTNDSSKKRVFDM